MILDWSYEQKASAAGFQSVCGVDEAGRGPLAGPVVAAAVILPQGIEIAGLNDSKKLSDKKREVLFEEICEKAIAYSIASVDEKVIDEINILQATFQAMRNAIAGLPQKADFAYIDGNRVPQSGIAEEAVVKGDGKVPSIAAASILAKVTRDRYMIQMAEQYPAYGFEKHKGYPTKAHYAAIDAFGACPMHRVTYLKKYYANKSGIR